MDNRKQMFQVVCDKCGKNCEVPFRPSGGKPVLCRDCFGQQRNKHQGRSGDRHNRSSDRKMFQAVCDKCGKNCEVPFRPTAGKPIYCNECFGKSSSSRDRRGGRDHHRSTGNDQLSQQLKSLSNKLDKVLNLLDSGAPKKEFLSKQTAAKSALKKSATGKKTTKKAAKKKK